MEKGPNAVEGENRRYDERQDEYDGHGRERKEEQDEGHREEEQRHDARDNQGSVSSSPKPPELGLVPLLLGLLKPRTPLGAELCFEGLDAQETLGEVPLT